MNTRHLGYSAEEMKTSPYARFFDPHMAALPDHVLEALSKGVVARELLPPVERASELQAEGYAWIETGYTTTSDGAARIACLTQMPGVTPAMWEWWFAWHGSEAQRYKLWHPLAHVDVRWADGRDDPSHFVGRTSHIVEYIGAKCLNVRLTFVSPSTLGFDETRLEEQGEVIICGRGAIAGLPVDAVWLVHHIRPVPGGAEMRSRFWMGGANVNPRGMSGGAGKMLGLLAAQAQRVDARQAAEMLIHDAQEMNHLAAILPELYATFAAAGGTRNQAEPVSWNSG
jgi:hypothetical protein